MKKDTTDFGFKQVPTQDKSKLVEAVFDSVAGRYDLMNDVMSLGIHRLWKRHAIAVCQIRGHQNILDLAAGSGDLACLILKKLNAAGQITLCDINHSMLRTAQNRLIDQGYIGNVHIAQGNAEALPFTDNFFDRIVMGFGLRNVTHKDQALAQIYRVLKPGGRAVILEFSHPVSASAARLYDLYSFHILPLLGKYIANDSESYRYLAESIRMHPKQEILREMILAAGFDKCDYQNLTHGVVAVHCAIKY